MTRGGGGVSAVVVATRRGGRLAVGLDAVAWADERVVLDPAGDVRAADLPAGVRVGRRAETIRDLATRDHVVLLAEDEVPSPSFAAAVARARAQGLVAHRPTIEIDTLGIRFAVRRAPVRLAPRAACRIALTAGRDLALASPAPVRRLEASLRAERGASVADAYAALEAEGRALSALLAQVAPPPNAWALMGAPAAAAARLLTARVATPAGLARWVAAVLAAYRVVAAHGQWWERRHAAPGQVRELG